MAAPKNSAPKQVTEIEAETRDEIEEIMSEIESLQQEMADAPTPKTPPAKLKAVPSVAKEVEPAGDEGGQDSDMGLEDFHGSGDEPSMEETLGAMKDEEPAEGSLLDVAMEEEPHFEEEEEAPIEAAFEVPMAKEKSPANEGSLTLSLSGSMTLKLKYEFEGQEVIVGFKDQFLQVTLADGTEFKVPVGRKTSGKAA